MRAGPPPRARPLRALALADEPPHAPIRELVASHEPDLILVLGDLEPAWTEGLADVTLPKLGVAGNHDAPDAAGGARGRGPAPAPDRAGRPELRGFGGSPRYSRRDGNEWTEEEAEAMLARLPAADVLLTHSPPAGVNDEPGDHVHRGSQALREWVERERAGLAAPRPHAAEPGAPGVRTRLLARGARARSASRWSSPVEVLDTPMGQA